MAKGNLLQGQGAGKVGDLVFMVRQGEQVARVYTKAGARTGDAASEASRIQRVRFGAASNQWDLYKYVCTRMYRKGKSGNQSDYNYFVKRNSALLPYLTKQENADGVHCLMPGLLSEGKLGRIEISLRYDQTGDDPRSRLRVFDSQVGSISQFTWSATMASAKNSLRAAYPSASKLTFLISFAPIIFVEESEEDIQSQAVRHTAVTIDLYKAVKPNEDTMTLKDYFASYFADTELATLFANQTSWFAQGSVVFRLQGTSADEDDLVKTISAVMFATDDNASDCYTTSLPADGVPPTVGPYQLYASYRTQEALRLACESYGYQGGVMRDDIAKFGNSLQQQQVAYAARMRSLGVDIESAEE